MDTVLLYPAGAGARNLLAALAAHHVLPAGSLAELTRLLVGEPDVLCLVLQPGKHAPEDFLDSLKASFPVLPVLLVPEAPTAGELTELSARIESLQRTARRNKP